MQLGSKHLLITKRQPMAHDANTTFEESLRRKAAQRPLTSLEVTAVRPRLTFYSAENKFANIKWRNRNV
jgi:hypothetical protein